MTYTNFETFWKKAYIAEPAKFYNEQPMVIPFNVLCYYLNEWSYHLAVNPISGGANIRNTLAQFGGQLTDEENALVKEPVYTIYDRGQNKNKRLFKSQYLKYKKTVSRRDTLSSDSAVSLIIEPRRTFNFKFIERLPRDWRPEIVKLLSYVEKLNEATYNLHCQEFATGYARYRNYEEPTEYNKQRWRTIFQSFSNTDCAYVSHGPFNRNFRLVRGSNSAIVRSTNHFGTTMLNLFMADKKLANNVLTKEALALLR